MAWQKRSKSVILYSEIWNSGCSPAFSGINSARLLRLRRIARPASGGKVGSSLGFRCCYSILFSGCSPAFSGINSARLVRLRRIARPASGGKVGSSLGFRCCYSILFSGCSAARLARFVRDEEVGSSNLPTPT